MSEFETITFDVTDAGVATLTFNRPKHKNAISLQMREELPVAIKRAATDPAVRVLIITGAGGSFCAGGDIKDMGSVSSVDVGRNRMRGTSTLLQAVASIDKPVIAAVDGPAYGAGFGWAMLADFVLATPQARFCASFGKLGLAPDFGLHYTLPRLVGLANAKDLLFSAREVKGDEALEMGLVYRMVENDKIADVAQEMAAAFCNASPTAIGVSKMLLDQTYGMDIRQIGEAEATNQAVCFVSDYHQDAAARFLDKQPFKFKWPH